MCRFPEMFVVEAGRGDGYVRFTPCTNLIIVLAFVPNKKSLKDETLNPVFLAILENIKLRFRPLKNLNSKED